MLAIADVFVMCSESEGMALSWIEAMMSGLPSVASGFEVAHELRPFFPENAYKIVEGTDPKTWAEAILEADAIPLETRFKTAQVIGRDFSAAAMAERWESYLLKALDEWLIQQLS
jgi:glycosyltransferase involved in cell wall biosynthesis